MPLLHVLFQRVFYPRLRHSAHNLVNRLPILEHQQGRNSHNVKPTRRPRVLVRVQLPKSHLPLVLLSKRINNWADQATGSTPRCPAVDKDQGVLGDEGAEAGIVHLYRSVRRIGHVEFNSRLVRSDICLTPLGFRGEPAQVSISSRTARVCGSTLSRAMTVRAIDTLRFPRENFLSPATRPCTVCAFWIRGHSDGR